MVSKLTSNQFQKWLSASSVHGATGSGGGSQTTAEILNQASGIIEGLVPFQLGVDQVVISPGTAVFLDDQVPSAPIVTTVNYPGETITLNLSNQDLTWFFLRPDGTIFQKNSDPDTNDYNNYLSVGQALVNNSNLLAVLPARDMLTRKFDFFRQFLIAAKVMHIGIKPAFHNDMSVGLQSGYLIKPGFAFNEIERNPNIQFFEEEDPLSGGRFLALTSTSLIGPLAQMPDASEYDVVGIVSPNTVGAGSAVNFRLSFSGALLVQYGATVYPTLRAAALAAYDEVWTIIPMLRYQAVLLGVLSVPYQATDLLVQAVWQNADSFGQLNSALSNLDKI